MLDVLERYCEEIQLDKLMEQFAREKELEESAFQSLSKHAKAAKVLREHLSKLQIFSYVHALIEKSDNSSEVIVGIEYGDNSKTEFVLVSFTDNTDFFDVLVTQYGVNYSAYVSNLTDDWMEKVYWGLKSWEDEFNQENTYANVYVDLGSRISSGVAFTLYGWWTDEDLLTGHNLAWWEHALGILDVAEVGALGKAAIQLKVLMIGGKAIKMAELTVATRKLLAQSFAKGVTFTIENSAWVLKKGGEEIGRLVDGTLQATKILPEGTRLSETIDGYYLAMKDGVLGFVLETLPSIVRQLTVKPSYLAHRTIWSKANQTTTLIGRWQGQLSEVYAELGKNDLNIYLISGKFENPGGFNILSIEDWTKIATELEAKSVTDGMKAFDDYIWDYYNKPWLESAM